MIVQKLVKSILHNLVPVDLDPAPQGWFLCQLSEVGAHQGHLTQVLARQILQDNPPQLHREDVSHVTQYTLITT